VTSSSLAPILLVPAVFVVQLVVQKNLMSRFDYRCGDCGRRFELSPLAASVAPHRFGGAKLVQCPHCGTRTWASPVRKLPPDPATPTDTRRSQGSDR
jgi:DNA-directed RNA polymerase subunit RPC12/RpoP